MMKKILSFLLLCSVTIASNAQQVNGSFDADWETCTPWITGDYAAPTVGTQPQGWKAANVAGYYLNLGFGGTWVGSTKVVTSFTGYGDTGYAAQMKNVNYLGNIIPGYMSLGTPWNTAKTNGDNADGGTFGGLSFTYHPDALTFKYKRSLGADENSQPASVVAYLWTGTTTQTNVPGNVANSATTTTMTNRDVNVLGRSYILGDKPTYKDFELIATIGKDNEIEEETGYRAEDYITEITDTWTDYTCYFDYHSTNDPTMINIIFAAMENYAGKAKNEEGNTLIVDDVKLVYWHALSELSYEGATINFNEATTEYAVDEFYDASKLNYSKKGQGATVVDPVYDEGTGILTIRVEGEDYDATSNPDAYTEYKIQFATKKVKDYNENLYITVDGNTTPKETATVSVTTYPSGNIDFALNDFILKTVDADLYIGNIVIDNLVVNDNGTFSYTGNINIEQGEVPSGAISLGLTVVPNSSLSGSFNDDRSEVYVVIDISLGTQVINVHYGYDRATMAVNSTAQYGTFCAPFAVTIPDGVTASTVTSVDANGLLTLTALSTTIPANTPVVLYAESGYDETEIFGVAVSATTLTSGLLTGVYTATTAPEGSYVLQNQDGNVAFYLVTTNDITVPANRCYLTTTAPVKALVFPDGTQTSISAIQANDEKAVMYDLSGRRVSKATKGIYITNGKKVLVK